MGTAGEWMNVIGAGAFWGSFMFLCFAWKRKDEGRKPALRFKDMLIWALGGLAFGTWDTFDRRALQWPLILVSVVSFLCMYLVVKFVPPATEQQQPEKASLNK